MAMKKFLLIITTILVCTICIFWLLGIRLYKMPSNSSMFPTLKKGDYFLVKSNPEISVLKRGDIVLIHNHTDVIDLPLLTKRIIGLPNETISTSNDSVFVEKVFLSESYAYFEIGNSPYSKVEKLKIADGHYFVMGDNRDMSIDSRDSRLGTIDANNIIGKVIWIF